MVDDSKLRFSRATPAYPSTASSAAAASARSASADPLVELARLIGQDDGFGGIQHDTGAAGRAIPASERLEAASRQLARSLNARTARETTVFEPRRTMPASAGAGSSAAAAAAAVREPEYVYSHATPIPPTQRGTEAETQYAQESHYAEAADYEPQAGYADDYYEGQEGDPNYPYADEDLGPLPPEGRRGGLMTIVAVLGLAGLGTVGAFGYWAVTGTHSGPPPIIKADTAPTKIVPPPKNDGPPSKAAYDRGEKGQIERILTREEQPIEMGEARSSAPRMVMPSVGGAAVPGSPTQAAAPVLPGTTGTIPSIGTSEPKRVRTVAIRPDGSIAPETARDTSAAPVPPTQPAPAVPIARPGSGHARTAAAAPVVLGPHVTGSTVSTERQAAAAGTHVVQLTSQRSEAEAQASFRMLQERYPNILNGWQPLIRRVDLGSRGTYYRAQVGPFASIEQANAFCGNLKAAGGQCIVQRN